MEELMNFLTSNLVDIGQIVLMILGVGSIVAKITPTQVDNTVIDFLLKVVNMLGLTKKDGKW